MWHNCLLQVLYFSMLPWTLVYVQQFVEGSKVTKRRKVALIGDFVNDMVREEVESIDIRYSWRFVIEMSRGW